jgi:CTP:phosphocholine cytidylyltransferase-like protein
LANHTQGDLAMFWLYTSYESRNLLYSFYIVATCLNNVQKHDDVLEFFLNFRIFKEKNLKKYYNSKKLQNFTTTEWYNVPPFVPTIMLRHLSDRVI